MKVIPRQILLAAALVGALAFGTTVAQATDPLPSWNDGPTKQAIVEFVQATTTQGSPKFVPVAERIATFDQDGTTWVEQPLYSQVMFAFHQVGVLAKKDPKAGRRRALQDCPFR